MSRDITDEIALMLMNKIENLNDSTLVQPINILKSIAKVNHATTAKRTNANILVDASNDVIPDLKERPSEIIKNTQDGFLLLNLYKKYNRVLFLIGYYSVGYNSTSIIHSDLAIIFDAIIKLDATNSQQELVSNFIKSCIKCNTNYWQSNLTQYISNKNHLLLILNGFRFKTKYFINEEYCEIYNTIFHFTIPPINIIEKKNQMLLKFHVKAHKLCDVEIFMKYNFIVNDNFISFMEANIPKKFAKCPFKEIRNEVFKVFLCQTETSLIGYQENISENIKWCWRTANNLVSKLFYESKKNPNFDISKYQSRINTLKYNPTCYFSSDFIKDKCDSLFDYIFAKEVLQDVQFVLDSFIVDRTFALDILIEAFENFSNTNLLFKNIDSIDNRCDFASASIQAAFNNSREGLRNMLEKTEPTQDVLNFLMRNPLLSIVSEEKFLEFKDYQNYESLATFYFILGIYSEKVIEGLSYSYIDQIRLYHNQQEKETFLLILIKIGDNVFSDEFPKNEIEFMRFLMLPKSKNHGVLMNLMSECIQGKHNQSAFIGTLYTILPIFKGIIDCPKEFPASAIEAKAIINFFIKKKGSKLTLKSTTIFNYMVQYLCIIEQSSGILNQIINFQSLIDIARVYIDLVSKQSSKQIPLSTLKNEIIYNFQILVCSYAQKMQSDNLVDIRTFCTLIIELLRLTETFKPKYYIVNYQEFLPKEPKSCNVLQYLTNDTIVKALVNRCFKEMALDKAIVKERKSIIQQAPIVGDGFYQCSYNYLDTKSDGCIPCLHAIFLILPIIKKSNELMQHFERTFKEFVGKQGDFNSTIARRLHIPAILSILDEYRSDEFTNYIVMKVYSKLVQMEANPLTTENIELVKKAIKISSEKVTKNISHQMLKWITCAAFGDFGGVKRFPPAVVCGLAEIDGQSFDPNNKEHMEFLDKVIPGYEEKWSKEYDSALSMEKNGVENDFEDIKYVNPIIKKLRKDMDSYIQDELSISAIKMFRIPIGVFTTQYLSIALSEYTKRNQNQLISVNVNRFKAKKRYENPNDKSNKLLLEQLVRSNLMLNLKCLGRSNQIWSVNFIGENAFDAGGPCRELIMQCAEEMVAPYSPVFIETPNGSRGFKNGSEYLIPNPEADPNILKLCGALIAAAACSNVRLPISLPPFVFNALTGREITLSQVAEFDNELQSVIYRAESIDGTLRFVCRNTLGNIVPLTELGFCKAVDETNYKEFIEKVKELRVGEMERAIGHMKEGFDEVIPPDKVENLFGRGIAELATSHKSISAETMLSITSFVSCSKNVQNLVEQMFSTLTPLENSKLLQFATGMSTPPVFKRKILIIEEANENRGLPYGMTCGHTLLMPAYKSLGKMVKMTRVALDNMSTIQDGNLILRYLN